MSRAVVESARSSDRTLTQQLGLLTALRGQQVTGLWLGLGLWLALIITVTRSRRAMSRFDDRAYDRLLYLYPVYTIKLARRADIC